MPSLFEAPRVIFNNNSQIGGQNCGFYLRAATKKGRLLIPVLRYMGLKLIYMSPKLTYMGPKQTYLGLELSYMCLY